MNWIDKIAPVLDDLIPELGTDNVIFRLDLSEIANHEDWTAEGIRSVPPVTFIPSEVSDRVVSLRLPIPFVTMGYSPKNDAECLLVKAFVHGALEPWQVLPTSKIGLPKSTAPWLCLTTIALCIFLSPEMHASACAFFNCWTTPDRFAIKLPSGEDCIRTSGDTFQWCFSDSVRSYVNGSYW